MCCRDDAPGSKLVEITGGEPSAERRHSLMERLIGTGYEVLLETGGHIPLDDVPTTCAIVDVKCPGSAKPKRCTAQSRSARRTTK
jgi:7-carboxy-7-deazaguanine synthase